MQTSDSYNRGGFIAFLFSMIFSLVFFAYLALFQGGIDLKEIPEEATDTGPAVAGANQAAQVNVAKIQKPWEPNDAMVAHGATVFKTNCSACHGATGAGDGVAGASLVPPPRNFIEGKWKKGGDSASLFNTISTGIAGTSMAPFGHLPAVDRWGLVQFIRSITKNKVADDAGKLDAFAQTAK
jgi:high-affinity iron transporter